MTTYHATITHGDTHWLIHVHEIDQWTQARHLREADDMARSLVALMLDVPLDTVEVETILELPQTVEKYLKAVAEHREMAAALQKQAAADSRAAAKDLAARGVTVRDIGVALGVSYQRAHQLISS